jgi:hypothetical protein
MRRPAGLRFGAMAWMGLWAAACSGGPTAPPPANAPRLEAEPPDLTGSYWCSCDAGAGVESPRYACVIKRVGARFVLAKVGGTQRLRGVVVPDQHEGFTFTGAAYCVGSECAVQKEQKLHGEFVPTGHGGLRGTFDEDAMAVLLVPAPANAFGGASYGDDAVRGAIVPP